VGGSHKGAASRRVSVFDEGTTKERRTGPRVHVDAAIEKVPDVSVTILGRHYQVRDLSVGGFSTYLGDDTRTPLTPEGPVAASMIVGDRTTEMKVSLRHCSGAALGFEIVQAHPTWPFTVARLLGPGRLGKALRELPVGKGQASHFGGPVRCFDGGPTCILWVWHTADGQAVAARLFFGEQVVEWLRGRGVRTGRRDPGFDANQTFVAAALLALRSPPDPVTVDAARQILAAATLPAEICELLR
jgi:hypothetical protein